MYNVGSFVIADSRVIDEPWDLNRFAIVAFAPLIEKDELAYHGYMLANTGEGFLPEMIFYLKPGEPLLYGSRHGAIHSADPTFEGHLNMLKHYEELDYNVHFSLPQKLLHHVLVKSVFTDWLVPDPNGIMGAFDLNKLPIMDWEETDGVGHYLYINDDSWFEFSEDLWDAGIPFWTEWLPSISKKIEMAIDVELAEARLQ